MNKITIALIAIACLIVIFLYYKFKPYEKSLYVVSNDDVTNRKATKLYFMFSLSNITAVTSATAMYDISKTTLTPPTTIPARPRIDTISPIIGLNREIGICNISDSVASIKGMSVYFTSLTSTAGNISAIYRIFNSNTSGMGYTFGSINLLKDNEIAFTSNANYKIDRIIISIDDPDNCDLLFYVKATSGTTTTYKPVIFKDLNYNYLTIDLRE